jgi:hypothetical protein
MQMLSLVLVRISGIEYIDVIGPTRAYEYILSLISRKIIRAFLLQRTGQLFSGTAMKVLFVGLGKEMCCCPTIKQT